MLSLLPWVAASPEGRSLEEIEAHFDYPADLLLSDLTLLRDTHEDFSTVNPLSGVDIELNPDGRHLRVRCPRWLSHPIRLSADEAARLFTAGSAMLAAGTTAHTDHANDGADGTGGLGAADHTENDDDTADGSYRGAGSAALVQALAKLQLMLNDSKRGLGTRREYSDKIRSGDFDASTDASIQVITLGDAPADTLDELRKAVRNKRQVRIEYYTFYRDELTRRTVDPAAVFSQDGAWYLQAWCHQARDLRVFRVDRIGSLEVTDTEVVGDPAELGPGNFHRDESQPQVTLRLAPEASWVADHYPISDRRDLGEGRIEVDLAVSALPWLARLLLQLGHDAEVVNANEAITNLRAGTAERILSRYR